MHEIVRFELIVFRSMSGVLVIKINYPYIRLVFPLYFWVYHSFCNISLMPPFLNIWQDYRYYYTLTKTRLHKILVILFNIEINKETKHLQNWMWSQSEEMDCIQQRMEAVDGLLESIHHRCLVFNLKTIGLYSCSQ